MPPPPVIMEHHSTQKSNSLEDQLRDMILSNVTIGPTSQAAPTYSPHQQYRRGRGRNRGRVSRGANQNLQSHTEQIQHETAPTTTSPSIRGRSDISPPQRGHHARSAQPRTPSDPQSPIKEGSQGHSTPSSNRRGPRPHQQPHQHGRSHQVEPLALNMHAPKILQRAHDPIVQNRAQGATPQHAPRRTTQYVQHQILEDPAVQAQYLDALASQEVPKVEITIEELEEKEAFRTHLENMFRKAFAEKYYGDIATISLVGFGSLASGFATPGSDMDLAVVPEWKDPSRSHEIEIDREIPRLLEKAVLDSELGGRLLTRTRVPILKVCQNPSKELYTALFEERKKWDELPEEEKYPSEEALPNPSPLPNKLLVEVDGENPPEIMQHTPNPSFGEDSLQNNGETSKRKASKSSGPMGVLKADSTTSSSVSHDVDRNVNDITIDEKKEQNQRSEKPWLREKLPGPLDFPKMGVGIQCDINFENPLGLHNTHLLRCYSLCDPRVRPMVLFIKSWAKRRKINSSYSGTLSSYGWVLMVLHYLVNVTQPPVCPNLQISYRPPTNMKDLEQMFKDTSIGGWTVRFWRNEQEIMDAARRGFLTKNRQSVGDLLRGFFQYYSSIAPGYMYGQRPRTFYWTTEVLSLRTPGGIRSKQEKGWVSATTIHTAARKVTNRYLFAIEDPFELDHNVARTVTHRGIVAIRDEFRRAWRIISAVGKNMPPEGLLFDEIVEQIPMPKQPEEEKKMMGMEELSADVDESGDVDKQVT